MRTPRASHSWEQLWISFHGMAACWAVGQQSEANSCHATAVPDLWYASSDTDSGSRIVWAHVGFATLADVSNPTKLSLQSPLAALAVTRVAFGGRPPTLKVGMFETVPSFASIRSSSTNGENDGWPDHIWPQPHVRIQLAHTCSFTQDRNSREHQGSRSTQEGAAFIGSRIAASSLLPPASRTHCQERAVRLWNVAASWHE